MNLSVLLEMAVEAFGQRTVIGPKATGYTARELRDLSLGGAAIIREAGADALVYLDVNGPCFPVALFAAAQAGVPLVPLNYRLSEEQLSSLLAKRPGALAIGGVASKAVVEHAGLRAWTTDAWLADSARRSTEAPDTVATDTPAVIIYTSGTTSEPKGVLLQHANLVSYVLGTVEFAGAGEDEASLVSVPPYHIAAVANAITNLYAGRRCIVLEQFSGEEWLRLVRTEQVTHALVVPTMLARIIGTDGDQTVPTLRSLAYGGAAMPQRVIERALEAWPGVAFVNAYGLTETSSTISVLGPDEHRAALHGDDPAVRARLGSAGLPVPTVEVQIRDEAGATVPAGTPGRIWVRGEQVSGEYAGLGSMLDPDGFFDTRDDGYLDSEGYLFIVGRTDDTIIRGGENIAPAEIEEVILAMHEIDDVAVVGIPDPEWGQRLEAVVVASWDHVVDPEQVRNHVRAHLRSSKTPDRIHVWGELPRTETGKIVRRTVLDRIQDTGSATAG